MGTKKKNQKNVYKEFWGLAASADRLAELDLYDVDMLIEAWKHQLKASNFFYGTLVKNEPNHDANKVYYRLNSGEPKEHQLVYAQIGRGYSKELFDPHWCYVMKHCKTKLLVVPVTSIKPNSTQALEPYEFDILESNGIKARMHFDDMRSIDKMRILENKSYIDIKTKREDIEEAVIKFLGFSEKSVDKQEDVCYSNTIKKEKNP